MWSRPWRSCRTAVVVNGRWKVVVARKWCMRCSWWLRPIVVISYLCEYFTRVSVHVEGWAWAQKRSSLRFWKSDDREARLIWYYSSPPFHLNLYQVVRKSRRLWPNSLIPQTRWFGQAQDWTQVGCVDARDAFKFWSWVPAYFTNSHILVTLVYAVNSFLWEWDTPVLFRVRMIRCFYCWNSWLLSRFVV